MKFELIADHFKRVDRPYTSHASSKAIDKKVNIKAIQTNDSGKLLRSSMIYESNSFTPTKLSY